jgi:hypothetical protein
MRRILSPTLIGLGAFLIVLAVLVRFYAYPTLAKVPADYDETTDLQATGATVFNSDPAVLASETTDLTISAKSTADGEAMKKAPDNTAIWVMATTIARADGSIFKQTTERDAFDATTGVSSRCCGTFTMGSDGQQVPTTMEGQAVKWPFDTQKKDYQVWDSTLGRATTAEYTGTTKIDGLSVYTFRLQVAPTTVGTQTVPGSLLGSDEASVDADQVYSVDRTFYVEPVTGSPVNRVETQKQELQYDGRSMPVFDAEIMYTPAQVASLVKDIKSKAPLLGGMRATFPAVLGILGLLALVGGFLLRRRQEVAEKPTSRRRELVKA